MTQYELVQARRYLQQDVLALRRVEGLSATTVKIVWDVSTIEIICDMNVIVSNNECDNKHFILL